ncbi:hypothetical protein ABBQ38_009781 [Trebouxia sp. C0009 RCD-2024]
MATPLPGSGSLMLSGTCDRHSALRHQTRSRSSVAGAQEPVLRLTVRPPSVSCQTCGASNTPSDSHSGSAPSSSQCRAGPSGNSGANRDINGSGDVINGVSDDALQPQQRSDSQSGGRTPVAGSEPVGTVVICGWLGSNKRYLKRYQDWWTQNGWEPVVFMMPMRGALTLGATAQERVEALVMQLAARKTAWKTPKDFRLLFHCFSNTGWYTFGAVMEGLLKHAAMLLQHVIGSVVDSAPHAEPCAKVWASGFATALLPRRASTSEFRQNVYAWMECFFEQWLKGSPGVRLQQLAAVLQKYQTFPQLYIYSESDHVVPHTSVEAFMEGQSKLGRIVSGMRFQSSPHVDHFRNNTLAYTEGLRHFVADALALTDPSRPSSGVMPHLHPTICIPEAL